MSGGEITERAASLRARFSADLSARAQTLRSGGFVLKLWVCGTAALIAGICQIVPDPSWPPTPMQYVGLAALAVGFLGARLSFLVDDDPSKSLAIAGEALNRADESELRGLRLQDEIDGLRSDLVRLTQLHQAVRGMRAGIEVFAVGTGRPIEALLATLLAASKTALAKALELGEDPAWTICIYQARASTVIAGRPELVCIAHSRAVDCELGAARVWQENEAAVGRCFVLRSEVIEADALMSPSQSSIPAGKSKSTDGERYQSVAAFPIRVHGTLEPWGVVCLSSSHAYHLDPQDGPGLSRIEAGRDLTKMAELAIAVGRCRETKPEPATTTASSIPDD